MSVHYLVVREFDPDLGHPEWEIEHPDGCPQVLVHGEICINGVEYPPHYEYNCQVGWEIYMHGLSAAFCADSAEDYPDFLPRTPGKYPIEGWVDEHSNYITGYEYESGIRLVETE